MCLQLCILFFCTLSQFLVFVRFGHYLTYSMSVPALDHLIDIVVVAPIGLEDCVHSTVVALDYSMVVSSQDKIVLVVALVVDD